MIERYGLPLAIFLSAMLPLPAFAVTYTTYRTLDGQENFDTLEPTDGEQILYSLDVGPIHQNDILVIDTETGATNDTFTTALWTAEIRLTEPDHILGTTLSQGNVVGLTHPIHHGVQDKAAIYKFSADSLQTVVKVVVKTTQKLTEIKSTGGLQVLKITP